MDPIGSLRLDEFLSRLASGDAVPGGGAAVAVTAAQAAALLAMAMHVSSKPPAKPDVALIAKLDAARSRFLDFATADGKAFGSVMACYQLPNGTDAEKQARKLKLQAAFKEATRVPLAVLAELKALSPLIEAVAAAAKPTIVSDVAIAVQLVDVAVKTARYNVRINLKYLEDETFRDATSREMRALTAGRKGRRQALVKQLTAGLPS